MGGFLGFGILGPVTGSDQSEPIGVATRVLLGVAIVIVAALWFLFLFGNPFAASAGEGLSDNSPIVVDVDDDGPESETLSNEELQQLLDEAGATHDGEDLVHAEPDPTVSTAANDE